jgi:WD40 repeat protein
MGVCWRRGVGITPSSCGVFRMVRWCAPSQGTQVWSERGVFAGWAFAGVGEWDKTIKLWRVADGSLVRTLTGHTGEVVSVVFSPDGRLLASGSGDGTIKLWRVADGSLVRTLTGHTGAVTSVSFSPDGRLLASGSGDRTIKLWRVADGSLVRTLRGHTHGGLRAWCFRRMGVCWRRGVLMTPSSCGAWRMVRWCAPSRGTPGVVSVSFSPDGRLLASGSWDKTIKLWRVSDGSLVRTLRGHINLVSSVSFSPDGRLLASGSLDGTIRCGGWRTARCGRPTTKKHSERYLSSSLRTGDCSGMDALMPPWWWRAIRSGSVAKETHSPRM